MGGIVRTLIGVGVLVGSLALAGCSAPIGVEPTTPSDEPTDGAATLVLTGAEIGATAMSALSGQVDDAFEIFCDEGEYEVTVGTQLTCTYADDNGDTPAYIEITAVDGIDYELSVSVP